MSQPPSGFTAMSPYEQKAWTRAVERLNYASTSRGRQLIGRATKPLASLAGKAWDKVPMHDDMSEQFEKALEGLVSVTMEPAMRSVNLERVAERVGAGWGGFHQLDLQRLDEASPGLVACTPLVPSLRAARPPSR